MPESNPYNQTIYIIAAIAFIAALISGVYLAILYPLLLIISLFFSTLLSFLKLKSDQYEKREKGIYITITLIGIFSVYCVILICGIRHKSVSDFQKLFVEGKIRKETVEKQDAEDGSTYEAEIQYFVPKYKRQEKIKDVLEIIHWCIVGACVYFNIRFLYKAYDLNKNYLEKYGNHY